MTLIFKHDRMPQVVQDTLISMGWVEYDENTHGDDEWNLHWKPTRPTMGEYSAGKSYQRLIHFPKTGILCTKDNLARLIKRNRSWFGKIYHFTPVTYCLPNETQQFVDLFTRQAINGKQEKQMWICKPTDLSRGRGIKIISKLEDLQYEQQSVIQEYIDNPLLIRGTKWDMRVYVLVTQMRPLKIYLFQEGIVRFSSERYNTADLQNVFSHLTNSSINKYAATNIQDGQSSGLKWSFAQLKSYFYSQGYDYDMMWARMEQIIVLTTINLCSLVPDLKCCFEILGFDIMLDDKMKPWLIEVNSSPAMSMETNIDSLVKPALIRDSINLCNFQSYKDWQYSNKKKSTTKTSNIHQNFFSKRTTAMSKKDEGFQGPTVPMSATSKKGLNLKGTIMGDREAVMSSQYCKPGSKLESLEPVLHQYQSAVNSNRNLTTAAMMEITESQNNFQNSEFASQYQATSSRIQQPTLKRKTQHELESASIASAATATYQVQQSSVLGRPIRNRNFSAHNQESTIVAGSSENHNHDEDDIHDDQNYDEQNDLDKNDGDNYSGEQTLESYHNKQMKAQQPGDTATSTTDININRKRSKPLISSYSTAANSKNAHYPGGGGGQNSNSYSTKQRKKQFEGVLPKVNSYSRAGSSSNYSNLLPPKASLQSDLHVPPSHPHQQTGSLMQQDSRNTLSETTGRISSNRDIVSSRNRTTEVRNNMRSGVNGILGNSHSLGSTYSSVINAAKVQKKIQENKLEQPKTEEQIKADQVKRLARLKHQNELNSRLSVKQSTLGKMLEKQKRKERIVNGHKADLDSIDRESGSLFRGMGGNRNRQSRLGASTSNIANQQQNGGGQNRGPGPQHIMIPDNYQLPRAGFFDREHSGQYELIFPFNKKTEEMAFSLNRQVGASASMGAPNFLKILVSDIKLHYEQYMIYIKNGRRYAHV